MKTQITNPLNDTAIWGLDEVPDFVPPPEVVNAILENQEIAVEYPDVYQKAIDQQIKYDEEGKENKNGS